jgi:hypothetical protein
MQLARRGFKNTQRLSNAHCAPNVLHVPIIFVHIFALILTSDLSFAQYAVKHSPVSTTANATKGSTLARRNSSVEVTLSREEHGVAAGDLREPMLWAVTSGVKLGEYVYAHYSRKRRQKGSATRCLLKGKCLTLLLATYPVPAINRASRVPVLWTQSMEWCSPALF